MKLKYYLRGMGIGVIITTLILMIAFHLHQDDLLTDAQICERAEQLGMVMPEELPEHDKLSDQVPEAEPQTEQKEPAADALTDEKADAADKVSQRKEDQKKEDQKQAEEPAADASDTKKDETKTDKKPKKEVVEQVELSIVGGEYSADVCKKLKDAGLIDNVEDFNRYLSDGGYDSLIQPGTYVIPVGADYDTIIRLITEKE